MTDYELKHGENFSYVENVLSDTEIDYLLHYWEGIELRHQLIGTNEWDVWSPYKSSVSHAGREVEIFGLPVDEIPFISEKIKNVFSIILDYEFGIEGPHYFTYYPLSGFHGLHKDGGVHNDVRRDKVVTIQLTNGENYEGGDLIINGEVAPRDKGTFILYSGMDFHEVTKVTKGHRFTITECAGEIQ